MKYCRNTVTLTGSIILKGFNENKDLKNRLETISITIEGFLFLNPVSEYDLMKELLLIFNFLPFEIFLAITYIPTIFHNFKYFLILIRFCLILKD